MGTVAPATTVLVDDLESRGLVKRQPHPADRRAKLVSLTAAGRRQLAVAQKIIDEPPAALVALPAKELALLRKALKKIERSEEHTSELQSLMRISYAVFCLKKKKK